MGNEEYGAVRNRDREQIREEYDELLGKGERSQIQAMRLVDGTEFFINNSANNISVKDGRVKDAKRILQSVSSIYDDKFAELQGTISFLEKIIEELTVFKVDLEKYQMESKIREIDELIELLAPYIPRLIELRKPVEIARTTAIEKTKKKIIHLHKNEFINRVK